MTIAEFRQHNKLGTMPCDWIGQGYGYKSEKKWDYIDLDEIIYIPEYAYNEDDDNVVSRDNAYSKSDFVGLIREIDDRYKDISMCNAVNRMAEELFDILDWQFPESLLNEGFFEEE